MDRIRKLELIQRLLGIRHKLRVHDSGTAPDTHEELSLMLLSKWELEDELRAIEEALSEVREANVASKKFALLKNESSLKLEKALEKRIGVEQAHKLAQ